MWLGGSTEIYSDASSYFLIYGLSTPFFILVTLIPSILSLISLWGVRIILSSLLIGPYGLTGIWIAMTAELCFRGFVMLIRLFVFPGKKSKL